MNRFDDIMGITIETGDAWLDRKLNNHICYKGKGQTAVSNKWLQPYATDFIESSLDAQKAGDLSKVAGTTADQQAGYDAARDAAALQTDAASQALTGTGLFAKQDFANQKAALAGQAREALGFGLQGQDAGAAARGTLGSARNQAARARAQEGAAVDLAGKFADLEQQDLAARRSAQQGAIGQAAAGAQTLQASGQAQQQQAQKEADRTYQGLQRLGGLFGAGAGLSQTKTASQGGK